MKKLLLYIIFVFALSVAHCQVYIGFYYGNNFSNKSYEFGDELYSNYIGDYWSKPVDTTYFWNEYLQDTMLIVSRDLLKKESDRQDCSHSFFNHNLLGIDLGYSFNKFLSSRVSYSFINLSRGIDIEAQQIHESFRENEIYKKSYDYHEISYHTQSLSLGIAIKYPIKKIEPELYFAVDSYFTKMKHDYFDEFYVYEDNSDSNLFIEWTYSDVSIGYKVGLGLNYNLYKNISIFGRVGYSWCDMLIDQKKFVKCSNDNYISYDLADSFIRFNSIQYSGYNFKIGVKYKFLKNQKQEASSITVY